MDETKQNGQEALQLKIGLNEVNMDHQKMTYMSGTSGVVFTFGCTTFPIANVPPPFTVSRQCEKIFLTFPADASCDSMDEFDWPNPRIPSRAWSDDPKPPPILAPHLQMSTESSASSIPARCQKNGTNWFPENAPKRDACIGQAGLAIARHLVVL